ncbi:hypothetical protein GGX14DRAFT_398590 [Mycena pura]|uniref:Uncharacterized protein n=1 Tax=Mycena pura TaxID=153505 RepID=A0AAD6VA16_9AGAR|nr:hypothetical protein GGX14DRAFT_398590 [Mycena pura]
MSNSRSGLDRRDVGLNALRKLCFIAAQSESSADQAPKPSLTPPTRSHPPNAIGHYRHLRLAPTVRRALAERHLPPPIRDPRCRCRRAEHIAQSVYHKGRCNIITCRYLQVWGRSVVTVTAAVDVSDGLLTYSSLFCKERLLPLNPGLTSTRSRGRRVAAVTAAVDVSGELTASLNPCCTDNGRLCFNSLLCPLRKIAGLTRAAVEFSGGVPASARTIAGPPSRFRRSHHQHFWGATLATQRPRDLVGVGKSAGGNGL